MRLSPKYRILGVDIEAQHGATWNFPSRIFFGAASQWEGEPESMQYVPPHARKRHLIRLWKRMNEPNIIVGGHNVGYDMGGLNGEFIRQGFGSLKPTLVIDTYKHAPKHGSMFSRKLGDLCEHYGVDAKGSISRYRWEQAYRMDPDALAEVKEYNIQDVVVWFQLRDAMLEDGVLGGPKLWKP